MSHQETWRKKSHPGQLCHKTESSVGEVCGLAAAQAISCPLSPPPSRRAISQSPCPELDDLVDQPGCVPGTGTGIFLPLGNHLGHLGRQQMASQVRILVSLSHLVFSFLSYMVSLCSPGWWMLSLLAFSCLKNESNTFTQITGSVLETKMWLIVLVTQNC